ncbi:dipeptide epimerase [Candidatus Bathyarchaeota archaeon]|nr:MAG: dipeptide epimerase [Candidatus Bathyarchaeota archaeon]
MGVRAVRIWSAQLPYREPFRTALGISRTTTNLLVEIETDFGPKGLGECSPLPRVTGETVERALDALRAVGERLIGLCPLRMELVRELLMELAPYSPAARAAVDMALFDILGQVAGEPLYKVLGGYREKVKTDLTIGLKGPSEMAFDALRAVEAGFRSLKLKVGTGPEEDYERVRAVRDAVGDGVELRVDANQAWSVRDAMKAIRMMSRLEVAFVEQPTPAHDLRGLAEVRATSPVPIMADESVLGPDDALRAIGLGAVDLINIKLMKCGGISEALRIAHVAEAAEVGLMVGCGGEGRLAITAGAHLAAALKPITYADLDSDLLLADDVVAEGGSGVEDGFRLLPGEPGLGVKALDHSKMKLVASFGGR